MRIAIAGAGPAGLHLAALIRARRPETEIRLVEQNAEGATFGFGVVFSDKALDVLGADDPALHAALAGRLESWQAITLNHPDGQVVIDGIGFTAIARLDLLRLLTARCRALGVEPEFGTAIPGPDAFAGYDLVVAADGVNSTLRRAGDFGTEVRELTNRFAWFGTTRRFDTLTQTFRRTPLGAFNAHHYRYAEGMSTFIVETDAASFARAGFDRMRPEATKALLEEVFARSSAGIPSSPTGPSGAASRFCATRLVCGTHRADRRCAADRAFLHRLRHPPRAGGQHRAGPGTRRALG
jgi:2-polyprenyl-6-methoxyphenol hydroxylase-like FAD-dependent oxidoreductase